MTSSPPPFPPPVGHAQPSSDMRPLMLVAGILLILFGAGSLLSGIGGAGVIIFMFERFPGMMEANIPEAQKTEEFDQFLRLFEKFDRKFLVSAVVGLFTYNLVIAVASIWLGLGSCKCRRWSYKLILASGWTYLGTTLLGYVAFIGLLPEYVEMLRSAYSFPPPGGVGASPLSPNLMVGINLASMVLQLALALVPGVVVVLVFGLRNVRLSCEFHDPEPRWTDKVSNHVLPLWILLVTVCGYLIVVLPVLPFLPEFLHQFINVPLTALGATFGAGATAYMAILVGQMKPIGWWLTMLGVTIAGFVGIVLLQNLDYLALTEKAFESFGMIEFWDTMMEEMPPGYMKSMEKMMEMQWLSSALYVGGLLAYLGWIKRFFDHPDGKLPDRLQTS